MTEPDAFDEFVQQFDASFDENEHFRVTSVGFNENFMRMAKCLHEIETYVYTSKTYVESSKKKIRSLQDSICEVAADLNSARECIKKLEKRSAMLKNELQSLFNSSYYERHDEVSNDNEECQSERNWKNTRLKLSQNVTKSEVSDLLSKYASESNINLEDYYVSVEKKYGLVFVSKGKSNPCGDANIPGESRYLNFNSTPNELFHTRSQCRPINMEDDGCSNMQGDGKVVSPFNQTYLKYTEDMSWPSVKFKKTQDRKDIHLETEYESTRRDYFGASGGTSTRKRSPSENGASDDSGTAEFINKLYFERLMQLNSSFADATLQDKSTESGDKTFGKNESSKLKSNEQLNKKISGGTNTRERSSSENGTSDDPGTAEFINKLYFEQVMQLNSSFANATLNEKSTESGNNESSKLESNEQLNTNLRQPADVLVTIYSDSSSEQESSTYTIVKQPLNEQLNDLRQTEDVLIKIYSDSSSSEQEAIANTIERRPSVITSTDNDDLTSYTEVSDPLNNKKTDKSEISQRYVYEWTTNAGKTIIPLHATESPIVDQTFPLQNGSNNEVSQILPDSNLPQTVSCRPKMVSQCFNSKTPLKKVTRSLSDSSHSHVLDTEAWKTSVLEILNKYSIPLKNESDSRSVNMNENAKYNLFQSVNGINQKRSTTCIMPMTACTSSNENGAFRSCNNADNLKNFPATSSVAIRKHPLSTKKIFHPRSTRIECFESSSDIHNSGCTAMNTPVNSRTHATLLPTGNSFSSKYAEEVISINTPHKTNVNDTKKSLNENYFSQVGTSETENFYSALRSKDSDESFVIVRDVQTSGKHDETKSTMYNSAY